MLYEYDTTPTGLLEIGRVIQQNRRLKAERTVYFETRPDDPAQNPPVTEKFTSVNYDDYEGLGHYRVRTLGGDFGRGDFHETRTRFNDAQGTFGPGTYTPLPAGDPWILDTYTFVEEEGGDSVDNSRRNFGFDAATGFLKSVRTFKTGTSSSNQDLYSLFCPRSSGDGAGGVQNEYHVGGDSPYPLPSLPTCNALPSSSDGRYRLDHTFSSGLRATTQYQGMPGPNQFLSMNLAIDLNTGLPSLSTDPAGVETSFAYDAMGRAIEIRPGSDEEAWTAVKYGDNTTSGRLFAQSYRCATNVTYQQCTTGNFLASDYVEFDGLGRVEEEGRKLPGTGWSTRLRSYDKMGHPLTVSSWAQGTESHPATSYAGYDAFGRPATVTLPDGKVTTYLYEGVRWKKIKQNVAMALSGTESCVARWEGYDRQGRLWRVDENPASCGFNVDAPSKTRYDYDEAGRLVEVCQELVSGNCGQTRSFQYDNRGFLLSETHPEKGGGGANGTVSYLKYDSRGHAREKHDGGSARTLKFTFDKAERLTLVEDAAGVDFKQFVFDTAAVRGKGKLHQATRWNVLGTLDTDKLRVTDTYEYLGLGGRPSKRTTQTTVGVLNPVNTERWDLAATYHALGGYASLTWPRCFDASCTDGSGTPARTRSFSYTNGFLSAIGGPQPTAAIAYATNQTVARVTHGNGVREIIELDASNRMARPSRIRAEIGNPGQEEDIWNTGAYQYDGAGNIKTIGVDQYRYDRFLRLVEGKLNSHSPVQSQLYGFDNLGNLTAMTTTVGAQTLPTENFPVQDTNPNPAYRPTNRLSAGTYDLAGNLTAWGTYGYTYDLFNQQTSYCTSMSLGNCIGEKWFYAYTADDERILARRSDGSKTVWTVRDLDGRLLTRDERVASGLLFSSGVSCPSGLPGTWVFCDGFESGNTVEWSNSSQGVSRKVTNYVWRGGGLLGAETIGAVPRYFVLDHLGTVRRITNDVPEVDPLEAHDYFPFGREATTPSSEAEPMKFTGHERDTLATPLDHTDDLDYLHKRFLTPFAARFLTVDPVAGRPAIPQSWNRYSYVRANPMRYVDPDGRDALHYARSRVEIAASNAVDTISNQVATGIVVGSLLLAPDPSDLAIGALSRTTVGSRVIGAVGGRISGFVRRIFSGSDEAAKGASNLAEGAAEVGPKLGQAGGPGSGRRFPESVREAAIQETDKCVFCGVQTTRQPGPAQTNIDHAVPRSRGGNNTLDNAQTTCRTCNLQKGPRNTEEFIEAATDR